MSTSQDDVLTSRSLSPAARVVAQTTSTFLRPQLRGGLARRRRLLNLVCASIGQSPAGVRMEQSRLEGVPVEICTPQVRSSAASVVYLHGGAYVSLSPRTHRRLVTRLAAGTGCRVVSVDYRLAPEYPFPAGLDDAVAAYTAELAERPGEKIVLAGESAGGGLTMATALALRDRGVPLPAALVCMSPWVDLTCSGSSMVTRARRERVLAPEGLAVDAALYAGGADLRNPLVSPLFADLSGLPPMLIQVGEDEILLDDSVRLAEAARAAGVPVKLQVWPRLWHAWQLYAGLVPEASAALRAVADFVGETLAETPH